MKKTGGKSAIGKGWKKRYFILSPKDATLTYYPKEGVNEVLGEVALVQATNVVVRELIFIDFYSFLILVNFESFDA